MKLSILIFVCFALLSYLARENFSLGVQNDPSMTSLVAPATASIPAPAAKKVPIRHQPAKASAKAPAKATVKPQPTQKPAIKNVKKDTQKPIKKDKKKKRIVKKETKPGGAGTARPNAAWFLGSGFYNERTPKR